MNKKQTSKWMLNEREKEASKQAEGRKDKAINCYWRQNKWGRQGKKNERERDGEEFSSIKYNYILSSLLTLLRCFLGIKDFWRGKLFFPSVMGTTTNVTTTTIFSIFYSTGQKWRSRRKLLTSTFHFKILNNFVPIYQKQSNILIQKLKVHNEMEKNTAGPLFYWEKDQLNMTILD